MAIDHLGPAVIGEEEFKRQQSQKKTGNSHLGPAAVMDSAQLAAWQKAGKPEPWREWLEDFETAPDLPPAMLPAKKK